MSTVQPPTALLAGVGERVVQFVIDIVLVALVSRVVLLPFDVGAGMMRLVTGGEVRVDNPLDAFVGLVVGAGLLVGVPLINKGRTIGMSALRIRVVAEDGSPVTPAALLVRWVLLVVDFLPLGLFGLVGLLVMTARPDQRRVGDIVARTYVVRG